MKDVAKWLLDREFNIAMWSYLDPLEYALQGFRSEESVLIDNRWRVMVTDYYTPTEWHEFLLAFPRALPIELKGIAP